MRLKIQQELRIRKKGLVGRKLTRSRKETLLSVFDNRNLIYGNTGTHT
jgi:hypothetical protein